MSWRTENDCFVFDISELLQFIMTRENTKRSVLQISARIFDPLGFLTCFTIRVKIMFQEIWEKGLDWDSELPDELAAKWKRWCADLTKLHQFAIPRYYFTQGITQGKEIQLHGFSDANEAAYGAVIYIKYESENGQVDTAMVISKARVAPLKKITLPRLELMGALLAARLVHRVKRTLAKPARIFMWSDSMITIHWIRGKAKNWKQFVSNRVAEIQALTDPSMWSHCEGKNNPADILTRGQDVDQLCANTLWWHGPAWLKEPMEKWPVTSNENISEENYQETRDNCNLTAQTNCILDNERKPVLDLDKYSSFSLVLRVTAWIKRFLHNCGNPNQKENGSLTAEELLESETYWVKTAQEDCFHKEISALRLNIPIVENSKMKHMNPKLDECGVLRLKTRLQEVEFSVFEREPAVLPPDHRFTELLIESIHKRLYHSGVRDTLVELRERYWVLTGRRSVKKIISRCLVCRRMSAKPGNEIMAPLPRDRITETRPFDKCGCDMAGPLYVKRDCQIIKAYILLITCCNIRCVHLELVENLSTSTFILALRRFIARRGVCSVMYSDNAKQFKKADRDLKEIWKNINSKELQEFFGSSGIQWKFIVERAPWNGGFYERLVKNVKSCLRRVLGRACLTYEEMETTVAEVEAVVNSRPLTYVYNELNEPTPLTPAHFLVGQRLTSLPVGKLTDKSLGASRNELIKRLKYRETLLSHFGDDGERSICWTFAQYTSTNK